MNLPILTPEQRIESIEKARLAREQKKLDCANVRTEYADMPYWRELASKYGVRLPVSHFPATEVKYVKRASKKLGVDLNNYVESTGCKSLKEYAEINENWSAGAMVGLFLEYVDELNENFV